MARRRYRRRYRKRGTWCSNIRELNTGSGSIIENTGTGVFSGTATLITNPNNNYEGANQMFTVKNVEATISASGNLTRINDVQYYVMYVPQGMNVASDYNEKHPEYILTYRYLGEPNYVDTSVAEGRNLIKMKSRLARKLNTGDSIILFVKAYDTGLGSTGSISLKVSGVIRWWSKAN